ncbi:MAG: S8 family serine peptidase [bacterium]|nr:S8 family serine peptidase [bacterium]
MIRRILIIAAMLLIPALAYAADFIPGELLVILKSADTFELATDRSLRSSDTQTASIIARHSLNNYEPLIKKSTQQQGDNLYLRLLSSDPDCDIMTACRELNDTGLFRAVSPNYNYSVLLNPNDPMVGSQWYVTNPTSGIKLKEAWDITTGDEEVVIAIIDTGLDWSHPDIAANAWHNPDEIAGNGLDDDANGYIDDIYGWDCGQNDNDPRPAPYHEAGMDVGFHGTHCGGIASATANNSLGIAGAGWSCKLMGLKTTNGDNFSLGAITTSFNYAMAELPDVISMSFGGPTADFGFIQALIDDAVAAGIVCVAAAGNDNNSVQMLPAACDHVISVGATNESNQRASFSTYGTWVDVAAPGEHIWSTIQSNYSFDFLTELLYSLSYGYDGTNPYMYCDGTSMACPLVAGVCGLVRSLAPGMTSDEMRDHLRNTGDNVSYDQPLGVKVNAFNAVDGLATAAPDGVPALSALRNAFPNPFNPTTTIGYSLNATGPISLRIFDINGRLVRELVNDMQTAGDHTAVWNGRDDSGHALPSGLYFARLVHARGTESRKLMLLK